MPILSTGRLYGSSISSIYQTATGIWSFSRDLYPSFSNSRYTTATGVDSLKDQTGGGRHLNQVTTTRQPAASTAGPNSRACGDFDGSDDFLAGSAISNFFSNSAGYVICSFIADALTQNNANPWTNDQIWSDGSNQLVGLSAKSTGAIDAYNWDGNSDKASDTISTATAYVFEWRHDGGNMYIRKNAGSWSAGTASGNTTSMTGLLTLASITGAAGPSLDGKIFEIATWPSYSASLDLVAADWKTHVGA